jgi:hypothetical protein
MTLRKQKRAAEPRPRDRKCEKSRAKAPRITFKGKKLVLDGATIQDSETFLISSDRYLHIYDQSAAKRVAEHSFAALERLMAQIELPFKAEWNDVLTEIDIRLRQSEHWESRILFQFRIDWERWAKSYSIAEFADAVQTSANELCLSVKYYREDDEFLTNGFGLQCGIESMERRVDVELTLRLRDVKQISEAAFANLRQRARRNAVVTFFEFPSAVRSACEQYLLYFVQFLADLGIEADAEVKHEAQRVLFSVTPHEGRIALEKVREALDVYLRIPDFQEFEQQAARFRDPAVQQLEANVHFLKGQLTLACATLQSKDATIAALQVANYQYEQILVGKPAPLHVKSPKQGASFPLVGDTVSLKAYEGKLLRIETTKLAERLPEFLKSLKRLVGIREQ